jgi:type IV pilus assembly protein PilA
MASTNRKTVECRKTEGGFTLIELLVVVLVIGIIASIAVTAYTRQIDKARVAAVAADLNTFHTGFLSFAADNDQFPPDSHLQAPYHLPNGVGVENYLPVRRWADKTPLGGFYNWEGPDNYPYAGISLFETTAEPSILAMLDERIDDGDLSQGRFRITPNSRYTYILAE